MASSSFAPTKINQDFLNTVPNRSALINQLIDEHRKHKQKKDMLDGFNAMAQDDEMEEWVNIANNPHNL